MLNENVSVLTLLHRELTFGRRESMTTLTNCDRPQLRKKMGCNVRSNVYWILVQQIVLRRDDHIQFPRVAVPPKPLMMSG